MSAFDDLIADANLGAEARTVAGNYPGTPAELIEQLKRELDNALQREQALIEERDDLIEEHRELVIENRG